MLFFRMASTCRRMRSRPPINSALGMRYISLTDGEQNHISQAGAISLNDGSIIHLDGVTAFVGNEVTDNGDLSHGERPKKK